MLETLISEYTYDETKTASKDNFEVKEIIPGVLLELRFNPPTAVEGEGVPREPGAPQPETAKIYVFKLAIPINKKNTIVFADPNKTPKGLENLKSHLNVDIGTKSIENIFKLPEFTMESLNVNTLTEKYQEITQKIKTELEKLTGK